MRYSLITIFFFLITTTTIYGQKSRVGEIEKFYSNFVLIPQDNFKGSQLTNDSILKYEKPIAIFFWASTCTPCIKELNAVKKLNILSEIEGKAKIIVISTDLPKGYRAAETIAKNNNWEFDMYFDKGLKLRNSLLNYWYGIPQVMVFDKNKKITLHKFGYYKGNESKIINKLKVLIDEE